MQSFRLLTEYRIALMFTYVKGAIDRSAGHPKKVEESDAYDIHHAAFSGFAEVFVSDDKRFRERYNCLTAPKPDCIDMHEFLDRLR